MTDLAQGPMKKAVLQLIKYVGEDPKREGLVDTPARVAKAWGEWTAGYHVNPKQFLTTFGEEDYDQMIIMKDINFYSHCEHHITPFFGVVHIGYIPNPETLLGISKLGRIVDMYAQRLQIQERMTMQIARCIEDLTNPLGVAVITEGRHLCTESRGLKKNGQTTIMSSMRGVFRKDSAARSEFITLVKG